MPKPETGGKIINMIIPEGLHTDLKVRAAEQKSTVKKLVVKAIESYLYDDEPIDEEEWAAIEEGRKAHNEGRTLTAAEIKEKYGVRD